MSDQLNDVVRLYVDHYLFEFLHKDKALRDAAPDLLAALQAVSAFQQSQMYDGAYEDPVWKSVRAAIAKAEGG